MRRLRNSGIEKVRKNFTDFLQAGAVEDAMKVLTDALNATKTVRLPRERGEPVNYGQEPDYTVRLAAARTMLEFKFGKPRQAIELTHDDDAGRQKGREEVIKEITADWDRTRRVAESWIEGMKRAEELKDMDVPTLGDVDID